MFTVISTLGVHSEATQPRFIDACIFAWAAAERCASYATDFERVVSWSYMDDVEGWRFLQVTTEYLGDADTFAVEPVPPAYETARKRFGYILPAFERAFGLGAAPSEPAAPGKAVA